MKNDLISRSALIAYVKELPTYDATDRGFIFRRYPSGLFAPDDIVKSIQCAPAVDAVEVVRCRDCEFFEIDEGDFLGLCKCGSLATNYCGQIYPEEDFFCAYGERRADDG